MVKRRSCRRKSRRNHMRGGYINLDGSNVGDSSMNGSSELSLAQGKNYDSLHSNQHGGQNMLPTNSTMNNYMMNPSMNSSTPSINASVPSMNSATPSMNSSVPSMNSSTPSMPPMNAYSANMNASSTNMNAVNKPMMGGQAPVGDQGLLEGSLRSSAHLGPLDRSFSEITGMKDQAGGRRRRRHRSTKRKGRRSTKGKSRRHRKRRTMRGGEAPVDSPDMLLTGGQAQNAVNGMNPEWKLVEDASAFNPRS